MAKDLEQQTLIPDVDHPAGKAIVRIARAIRRLDAERGEIQGKADEQREKLIALMEEHKLTEFAKGDVEVRLKDLKKVSVKKRASQNGNADDAGEEE